MHSYFRSHLDLFPKLDTEAFLAGIDTVRRTFESGRKIITCGNGGSAYAASHYITDWNKMVEISTGKPFRGVSLCDNLGLITAFGNDQSYEQIFSGQLRSMLEPGDLVIAVSGSGNSPNVVKAVEYANEHGGQTLAIVGYDGGKLMQVAQQSVWIPSNDMQLCEDIHLMFGHMVMKTLCSPQSL